MSSLLEYFSPIDRTIVRCASFAYRIVHRMQTIFLSLGTVFCLLFDSSTASNFSKLAIGDMFHNPMGDPPPNVLVEGDCIQYQYPRRMDDLKWGYIYTYREGIIEACMRNCSLEVGEVNFPPPNWSSDTQGLETDCFLKLEDAGGLAIMKGDPADPVLVKALCDNDNITAYDLNKTVAYELYLEDLYDIQADHWLEYGPERFSRNPSMVLRRMVWSWFPDDFRVMTNILATFPESNVPRLDSYEN